jgi:hypothetical protein
MNEILIRNILFHIPILSRLFIFNFSSKLNNYQFTFFEALDDEGLLRLSGSLTEMNNMREVLEREGNISFQGADSHAVAGLLKSFLRELPVPLINKELNDGASAILSKF